MLVKPLKYICMLALVASAISFYALSIDAEKQVAQKEKPAIEKMSDDDKTFLKREMLPRTKRV